MRLTYWIGSFPVNSYSIECDIKTYPDGATEIPLWTKLTLRMDHEPSDSKKREAVYL